MNPSPSRRPTLLVGVAVAAIAISAGPAWAAPLDRGSYVEVETTTAEVCGGEWNVETTYEGSFMIKAGHAGDPTPYFFDNNSARSVYTDPEDAERGFVISADGLFKDVRITHVSGTIYRFESIEVGRTMFLGTLDGRTIAHDQGQLQWAILVDTNGGSDLDDYELLDVALTGANGRHAISEADDATFCALVEDAISG